jgi:8-oxo-dGTP pyrophosphatase MutT (NUDIX family)
VEIVIRQAALCLFRRGDEFLVSEIVDPAGGAVLHRPPGGGLEAGETPEQAVRREVREELGIRLTDVRFLGTIDHVWHWKGRELRERAWVFQASAADDPRLDRGETLELLEADGDRFQTVWRGCAAPEADLPPLCPPGLLELLLKAEQAKL